MVGAGYGIKAVQRESNRECSPMQSRRTSRVKTRIARSRNSCSAIERTWSSSNRSLVRETELAHVCSVRGNCSPCSSTEPTKMSERDNRVGRKCHSAYSKPSVYFPCQSRSPNHRIEVNCRGAYAHPQTACSSSVPRVSNN